MKNLSKLKSLLESETFDFLADEDQLPFRNFIYGLAHLNNILLWRGENNEGVPNDRTKFKSYTVVQESINETIKLLRLHIQAMGTSLSDFDRYWALAKSSRETECSLRRKRGDYGASKSQIQLLEKELVEQVKIAKERIFDAGLDEIKWSPVFDEKSTYSAFERSTNRMEVVLINYLRELPNNISLNRDALNPIVRTDKNVDVEIDKDSGEPVQGARPMSTVRDARRDALKHLRDAATKTVVAEREWVFGGKDLANFKNVLAENGYKVVTVRGRQRRDLSRNQTNYATLQEFYAAIGRSVKLVGSIAVVDGTNENAFGTLVIDTLGTFIYKSPDNKFSTDIKETFFVEARHQDSGVTVVMELTFVTPPNRLPEPVRGGTGNSSPQSSSPKIATLLQKASDISSGND